MLIKLFILSEFGILLNFGGFLITNLKKEIMKTIKGKVVLLDSKNYSAITYTVFLYSALVYSKHYKLEKGTKDTYKHLYITSDEVIKIEDWVICKNDVFKPECKEEINDLQNWCKKIIATTDKSLNLPLIPQSFIETYIEEYNKGNMIENIEIEIEDRFTIYKNCNNCLHYRNEGCKNPKTNFHACKRDFITWDPKNDNVFGLLCNSKNKISIKPIKDSWNREEVIALCKQAYFDGHYEGGSNVSGPMMSDKCSDEEWIKENL